MSAAELGAWITGAVVCGTLAAIVVEDLRGYRIRNGWIVLLVGSFLASVGVGGRWATLPWHVLFAGAVLLLMFAAFALGGVGAGDAKLLAAACLWTGPEGVPAFAGALLVATLLSALAALAGLLPSRRVAGRLRMPLAPSVAAAWAASFVANRAGWTG